MDPAVNLHQYIFEDILRYLPAKELKDLTTVSKSWCNAITSSSILMKKFYLGVRGDWMNEGDLKDVVSCSNRHFQKIILSEISEVCNDVYEEIMISSNSWKTVEIYGLVLNSTEEFEKLVRTFDSCVNKLVLSKIKINEKRKEPLKFNLKNLKNLVISFCDVEITTSILQSAPNLISLELQHASEYDENVIALVKNMSALKKLEMRGEWFNNFFATCHFSEIQFQLEEFTISCIDYVMPKKILENFVQFLESQNTLKIIHLSEWFGLEALCSMYKMSNLKELSIFICPFFRWSIKSLPINNSIEILDVRALDVTDELFNLFILLSASPNLKTLRLRSINESLAQFIKAKLKKVSTISLVHFNNSEKVNQILPHVEFI